MNHLGLFEGIGGFSLAAHWMGWKTVAWCEWNEFGQRVLKYHFPEAIGHGDITKTDFTPYANKIDILTGGFPCQPYSSAGKRRGKNDDRHLWPQMCRAIREIKPRYIVGENVLGLVNWNGGLVFDEVCSDLEAEGYEVAPVVIPAAAVNAPHGRDRVWFIAWHTKSHREAEVSKICGRENTNTFGVCDGPTPDTDSIRLQQCENTGKVGIGQNEICGQGDKPTITSETNGKKWLTPDTDSGSERSPRKSGGIEGERSNGHLFTEQRRESPELNNRLHEFSRNAPDTDSDGQHQRHSGNEVNASQGGQYAQRNVEQGDEYGDVADTSSRGISGHRRESKREQLQATKFDKNHSQQFRRMGWEEFPTQPPICGGDDGLSRQLDGITFPKWRSESIKAYGNAIVPQVAFEIFKTIELYEKGL